MSGTKFAVALFLALTAVAAFVAPARADDPKMKVAILVFDGGEVIDAMGPHEVFGAYGDVFDVFTVAATADPVTLWGGLKVVPKYTFANAPQADILIVPGGDIKAPRTDEATHAWIKTQSARTRYTMSVCNGAYILAETGLLDGLSATTTRHNIPKLQKAFPKIRVVRDQRVVANGRIITTGGLSAGIDGALYIVGQVVGQGAAEQIALYLEYDAKSERAYLPGMLAINALPEVGDDFWNLGDWSMMATRGDRDHWLLARKIATKTPLAELRAKIERVYQDAGDWKRTSPVAGDGIGASTWAFRDAQGKAWNARLEFDSVPGELGAWLFSIHLNEGA